MSALLTLWRRDIVRFFRDKPRVIGGLVPPIVEEQLRAKQKAKKK